MNTNASSSTTNHWLNKATKKLEKAGLATARLDCLVLLEDATGKDRSYLLAHPEYNCQARSLTRLNEWVERRAGHEPLAYIRGKSEFYGREFLVNSHTLEPRPETETMISQFLSLLKVGPFTDGENVNWVVVDVGTGSGCIGITVKLEIPKAKVIATDIDKKCLETAKTNAKKLGADVAFYHGNLLHPIPPSIFQIPSSRFVVLANLPYVPDSYRINEAAKFEPRQAIFGGVDGLDLYRELFEQINSLKNKPNHVLTESLPFQHQELAKIATASGYKLQAVDDFIQVFAN